MRICYPFIKEECKMLVQFMLRNVLSFREETIIDMSAVNAYKEHECNLVDIKENEKILKVAAIYGANASGKSNLNIAMNYFQRIVAESLNNAEEDMTTAIKKYYVPFMFEEERKDSEFQVIELLGDFEYKYGFEYNSECIVEEWMYRRNLKTNRTVVIFERTAEAIEFGASVRKECNRYKDQIPSETLVLSFFNKLRLKTDEYRVLYSGIMDTLAVGPDFCEDEEILKNFLPSVIDEYKEKLIKFLGAIDTGIKDIGYDDNEKEISFFTIHVGRDGKMYPLNLYAESEGTIKSILMFIYVRIAISQDKSLFIDELNTKLHPLLQKFIVDLFYDEKSKAQLIYTTHDTTLMDKKFFRRDQIWFVQKDEYGYSELSSLSDFKVRSDASFEKDYLAGVYGGIPLIEEFDMGDGE